VSPRARVVAATVAAATAAASLVVVVAVLQTDRHEPIPVESTAPRKGRPPLALDLGVRVDAEARALRRAQRLYEAGRLPEARAIFARHASLEARVGKAMAAWPDDTVDRLNRLAGLHPQSAVVQLHLGLALFWARRDGAEDAWRAALEAQPDTPYAVTAGNLLFPQFARGLPRFVPSQSLPHTFDALTPGRRFAELERRAKAGDRLGTLYYGVALQRLGHQRSAARVFGDYARFHPGDAEAQVAAAVARFDKARPVDAFSRLGPLSRRFPRAATVRFHLGVLLLWSGELAQAERQLRLARRAEPGSVLADEAARYLAVLARAATR
jgi:tetratricopeptide (TPR) repeat protein